MDTLQTCLHTSNSGPAIIISGKESRTISHSSLAQNVSTLQQSLVKASVGHGTKVSIVLSNPYIFTVTFLAITLQGSVAAPLNQGMRLPELEYYYKDFGAELVVLSSEAVEKQDAAYTAAKNSGLRIAHCSVVDGEVAIDIPSEDGGNKGGQDAQKAKPDDPALVLHTSGTTGRPKAVPLTHANIVRSMQSIIKHYSLTPQDRAPVIMPLFHIHGLVAGLFAPLASGGAVIFTQKGGLAPSFFRDVVEHKATWYTGTPTLHRLVAQIPMKDLAPKFRFVRSCSSRLEGTLLRQLEERYGCPIVEAYAMTEAAHQVCSNPVDSAGTREGSVGLPTGVELKILDDDGNEVDKGGIGEISIKGTNVMKGYLNNDDANSKSFTAEGFFRTGDQGKIGEGGYVFLTGRIKELINKGGEKLSPVEIDNVINQHPDVVEAVTFTMPDEMYGEDIGVAVIVKEGTSPKDSELKAYVGERLLQTKVPKKIFFVDTIPKTPVGKMQRGLVAKTLLERTEY